MKLPWILVNKSTISGEIHGTFLRASAKIFSPWNCWMISAACCSMDRSHRASQDPWGPTGISQGTHGCVENGRGCAENMENSWLFQGNSQRIEKNGGFQRKIGQNMNKHDGCSISIVIFWRLASNGFPFALSTEHPGHLADPTHPLMRPPSAVLDHLQPGMKPCNFLALGERFMS